MAKIMLVEDDTNLSEIYQARLTAEGYDIVSAHDGEEALAIAAKEKPDLIISDVMMPKISGFEMLDILRNTEGLKEAKVIMLTALGQADDKTRADALGADRYLVKSQVTLEDIVKAAQELLTGSSGTPAAAPATADAATPTPVMTPVAMPAPAPMAVAAPPVAPAPVAVAPTPAPAVPVAAPVALAPVAAPTPATVAPAPTVPIAAPILQPAPVPPAPAPVEAPMPAPVAVPVAAPAPVPAPVTEPAPTPPVDPTAAADNKLVADAVDDLMEGLTNKSAPAPVEAPAPTPAPAPANETDSPSDESDDSSSTGGGSHKKIIKPISDDPTAPKPSLESLLADEERKNPGATAAPAPNAPVTEVPHQPGHIITPSAAESLNNGSGIDPNSIAL